MPPKAVASNAQEGWDVTTDPFATSPVNKLGQHSTAKNPAHAQTSYDKAQAMTEADAYNKAAKEAAQVMPPPLPKEPLIPFWYQAENNWLQCQEMMRQEFITINSKYTGQWFQDARVVEQTTGDAVSDFLNRNTGGKLGEEYKLQTRQAMVKDIFEDEFFPADNSSWFRGGEPGPYSVMPAPTKWTRLQELSMNCPYPEVSFAGGAFTPSGGRIYQGYPENFYLVAALQAIAMKPRLIANVFWPSHLYIQSREGPNDGLVSVRSASWGEYLRTIDMDHIHQINFPLLHRWLGNAPTYGDVLEVYRELALAATADEAANY